MRFLQISFLLYIVFFPNIGSTHEFAESKQFDFRKARWGMSHAEVLKSESTPVKKTSQTALVFESVLAKKNVLVEYFFSNDKLVRARYFVNQGYYDPSKHYYDFALFDKLLKQKYNEPDTFSKNWSVKKRIEEPQAVYLGYLSLVSKWKVNRSFITHTLKKDGIAGGIGHSVVFSKNAS